MSAIIFRCVVLFFLKYCKHENEFSHHSRKLSLQSLIHGIEKTIVIRERDCIVTYEISARSG